MAKTFEPRVLNAPKGRFETAQFKSHGSDIKVQAAE